MKGSGVRGQRSEFREEEVGGQQPIAMGGRKRVQRRREEEVFRVQRSGFREEEARG
jgi:hypothetical protein